jgi:glycine/D-amino acid oxidase-like deaminating enzyme
MSPRVRTLPRDDSGCGWIALLPPPPPARPLVAEERADCVIVGAGFTGLAVARRLSAHCPQWRIVLLDAQRAGFGASGRNSGFLVDVGHYRPKLGVEGNRRLVRLARAGIDELRGLVAAHGIDCAWTERGRLHGAVGDVGRRGLDVLCAGLAAMDEPYEWLDHGAVTAETGGTGWQAAVRTPGTVMMQPAALAQGLASALPAGVDLREDSPVTAIHRGPQVRVEAGRGSVRTPRLVLATNGFTPAVGFLRRRLFPLLTFGSLTRPLTTAERAALGGAPEWGLVPEEPFGSTVRRTRDQRILVRNTVVYSAHLGADEARLRRARENHRRTLRARFPLLGSLDFEHTWGGVIGTSLNEAQFFGRIEDNVWAAAGYNGVGVAMGTVSGTLLADLIAGADSPLLADLRALPEPAWIPPEPLLGLGVRFETARRQARALEEL